MRTIVGVMGSGGFLGHEAQAIAYELGAAIAEQGWVLLTGGSAAGVMEAASHGAHDAGGLVVGVLKGHSEAGASRYIDIGIKTGMGDARNVINVLTAHLVIALPGGAGTVSEIALGLKSGRTVIALGWDAGAVLRTWGPGSLLEAGSVAEAIALTIQKLADHGRL